MRQRFGRLAVIGMLCFVGACSYALPGNIQSDVESVKSQVENLYGSVASLKGMASGEQLANVQKRYGELVAAHGSWMGQVENAITKEIDYFENDEKYVNSVNKLNDASKAFEDAASEAGSKVDVPDFANELRDVIKNTQAERKHKKAADAVFSQLGSLKPWDKI